MILCNTQKNKIMIYKIHNQKSTVDLYYYPINCIYRKEYYRDTLKVLRELTLPDKFRYKEVNAPRIYFFINNKSVSLIGRSKLLHNNKIHNDYMDDRKKNIGYHKNTQKKVYDCVKCIYLPNDPNIMEKLYCAYLKLYDPPENKYKECNSTIIIDYINLSC
jgi:predicted Abi (CAAX) family protease